jgi:hypothetical protein
MYDTTVGAGGAAGAAAWLRAVDWPLEKYDHVNPASAKIIAHVITDLRTFSAEPPLRNEGLIFLGNVIVM